VVDALDVLDVLDVEPGPVVAGGGSGASME
jgi:hypothetical protein